MLKRLTAQPKARLQSWLASGPTLAFAVQLEGIVLATHQANVLGTTN